MTCETAETLLYQSLDAPLTQQERVALDVHLEGCTACRRERDGQRRLAHLADRWTSHTLASSDPGDAFNAQVLARLEAPVKHSPLSLGLPLAATLLLLTVLAVVPGHLIRPAWGLTSSLYSLPHWLAVNLLALPGDALALRHLPRTIVPLWMSILLPSAIGLNALFCLYARHSALRRSAS